MGMTLDGSGEGLTRHGLSGYPAGTRRYRAGAMPRLLVTGGTGLVGTAVVERATAEGWDVDATWHHRPPPEASAARWHWLDVRDPSAVAARWRTVQPDAVVHTAYVLAGPDQWSTIVTGSAAVAAASAAVGARLVHLSSDLVFGGRDEPYDETAELDPRLTYGRAKACAEALVEERATDAVVVRTSLLYRRDGDDPQTRFVLDALDGRSDVAFFVDEVRCPTEVGDLAAVLVGLLERPEVRGPLHVASPEALSRADIARLVGTAHGRSLDGLRTTSLAAAGTVRPGRVVLTTARPDGLPRCRPMSEVLGGERVRCR